MDNEITEFLQQRIDAGDFPSAVYLVGESGKVVLHGAVGDAVVVPGRIAAQENTIYDLASLTKPLITGLLIAKLIESGKIQLDSRVSVHLKEFDVEGKRMITLADLLTHTSHMPAWRPLYLLTGDAGKALSEISKLPLDYEQETVTYSDLGFIALGILIERFMNKTLAQAAQELILEPLRLTDTYFNPPVALRPRIAASGVSTRSLPARACFSCSGHLALGKRVRTWIRSRLIRHISSKARDSVSGCVPHSNTSGEPSGMSRQPSPSRST